jgi:long-chain acyl-CoA synthetase
MSDRVLLTGATGFLGMEMLARLLERDDTEIVALVRARDHLDASERISSVLAVLYDELPHDVHSRLRAVPGDVATPDLGLSGADRRAIAATTTAVAHCAASISFNLPLAEALDVNTAGTSRMLDLAAAMPRLKRFVHVSTAYVAGDTEGPFGEDDLERGQRFRNSYEQSKFDAERAVAERRDALPLVVARPSIVVGDRSSGWTPAFNVIYWPLRAFARGLLDELPVDPDGLIDIVPVDYVADALVYLLDHPEIDGRLNLVSGDAAITNADMIRLACDWLGRPAPTLRAPSGRSQIEDLETFMPYFDVATRFDDSHARAHLTPAGIETAPFGDFFLTIAEYAQRARWGKLKLTRQRAAIGV